MFAKALAALAAATVAFTPLVTGQSIVDIAVEDGRFTTLVAAVTAAGLAETLSGEGTFTVFAPTDEAFANVDVDTLLEEQWRAHLKSVLLYHVLGIEVFSTDLMIDLEGPTLEGSNVTVTSLDPPMINQATIIVPDIDASNGVIHVIDDVLLPPSMTTSIFDLGAADPNFSTLIELVTLAGLAETLSTLSESGPYTLFAPTNDAFASVPNETLAALAADPEGLLTDVLLYHVAPGIVLDEDLADSVTTIQGGNLTVSFEPESVKINGATVITADVLARNGVVHVIDSVLLPPSETAPVSPQSIVDIAVEDGRFSTLVAAVTAAGLAETLSGEGSFTVFAPTDEAFANVDVGTLLEEQWRAHLKSVLLYHVLGYEVFSTDLMLDLEGPTLEGSNVTVTSLDPPMINQATIIIPDIDASNGVIHVIDDVLLPPSLTESIVDLGAADPNFSTLVELVTLAGLAETLSGEGPFTLFAPTNDAFAAVPNETLAALAADPEGLLTDVLLYHVVSGIVLSEDLEDGATPVTLNGATADVSVGSGGVMINQANVVLADVLASNGVVHAIDSVLLPPAVDAPAVAPAEGYQRLKSDDYDGSGDACMEVRDGEKDVILGDCTADMGGWKVDDEGMIHTERDANFCLQAGDSVEPIVAGLELHIAPCDVNSLFQRWNFESGDELSPTLDDDFCAVWRGDNANVGSDPILLIECDHAEGKTNWALH